MSSCEDPNVDITTKTPFESFLKKIELKKPTILAGPPGTGKTKLVLDVADKLTKDGTLGIFHTVQFHPQYTYQDFIDGYKPSGTGFTPSDGAFRRFLSEVKNRRDKDGTTAKVDVLLIDEMNRADTSSVFGEVLTLLDDADKKEIIPARSSEPLRLFDSVVIVGTMNTADKTIALVDFALRRRFSIIFVPPDYEGAYEWIGKYGFNFSEFTIDEYVLSMRRLNNRIASHPLLGKGMMLGQSIFVPRKIDGKPISIEDIYDTFIEQIIPQLEAYLGYGAQHELDKLIGIDLREKLANAEPISVSDIIGLVRVLADSKG